MRTSHPHLFPFILFVLMIPVSLVSALPDHTAPVVSPGPGITAGVTGIPHQSPAAVSWFTIHDGLYTVVIFNQTGQAAWTPPPGVTKVDYLVVGGGGEGGNGGYFDPESYPGGGGGGGGVLNGTDFPVSGIQTVIVGSGGSGSGGTVPSGINGGISVFGTSAHNITALGGGGGAGLGGTAVSGGSGGGGSGAGSTGGSGTPGQGYAGGTGNWQQPGNPAGGGGGAAGPGESPTAAAGGNGGDGRLISITGTAVYYGSGGGGGIGSSDPFGTGGAGCGGDGSRGTANPAKCPATGAGGGGAGGASQTHGAGGSGVVILRYLTPEAPVAGFSGAPVTGLVPLTVRFKDTSANTPTSWRWTFGDGNFTNATQKNPVHTYWKAGTFRVSLNASNAVGSNMTAKSGYITVIPFLKPVANFTGTPVTGTAPLTVRFTDTSKNLPASWRWTFGDGNFTNATVKNPVHTYSKAGTYRVTLNATNAAGSNMTAKTGFIRVSLLVQPVADFTAVPSAGTAPLSVRFTDTSQNFPDSWQWDFGDGNATGAHLQNPEHLYPSAGSYTVSLTATNAAGGNLTTKPGFITVSAIEPVAEFTATPTTGANPLTVRFTDSSAHSPISWQWDFGDGNATNASAQNPVHTYLYAGTYTVSLNATNAAGSNTTVKSGFITALTAPGADFSGTPVTGKAPLTVRFTDASLHEPAIWKWEFGDGNTTNATVQNPVHTYLHPGIYTVSLNATNAAGSSLERKVGYITALSSQKPVANFSGTQQSGTAPLTVRFTDTSANIPTSWTWDFGDGDTTNATVQNPVHRYEKNGVYNVSLTATNTNGSNRKTKLWYITVSSFPQQTKILGAYTIVTFNGTGATSWRPPSGVKAVDYLVVGGGGEGGNAGWQEPEYYPGGGGGGGGVLNGTNFSVSGIQTVIVGAGGSGTAGTVPTGASGGKSVFGTVAHNITALGGGGGGGWGGSPGAGGSGGGGSGAGSTGGPGTAGQGYAGGTGNYTLPGNPAGGGGGAGSPGVSPVNSSEGGRGGDGRFLRISGAGVYYGSGGGGGIGSADPFGTGGAGCGGDGSRGTANPAKCQSTGAGGGGAGSGTWTHGAGGSGVVIIRYLTPL